MQSLEEQPDQEDENQEELAFQKEQAHQREQAESSEEDHEESGDYVEDDYASSAEEDEEPLSKSRRSRPNLADEEARWSHADEDKPSPSDSG